MFREAQEIGFEFTCHYLLNHSRQFQLAILALSVRSRISVVLNLALGVQN